MLVLTRKQGESIVIADDIVVTVMSIHGGRVSLGVSAPRTTRIKRTELKSLPNLEDKANETPGRTVA